MCVFVFFPSAQYFVRVDVVPSRPSCVFPTAIVGRRSNARRPLVPTVAADIIAPGPPTTLASRRRRAACSARTLLGPSPVPSETSRARLVETPAFRHIAPGHRLLRRT